MPGHVSHPLGSTLARRRLTATIFKRSEIHGRRTFSTAISVLCIIYTFQKFHRTTRSNVARLCLYNYKCTRCSPSNSKQPPRACNVMHFLVYVLNNTMARVFGPLRGFQCIRFSKHI